MKKITFQLIRILKCHKTALLILFLTWGAYFFVLWPRIIFFKSDGLYLGHTNVWSDWALHIGIASIFAYKSPFLWFAYHPMYAGGKFTYGFLSDFISGMFMRIGLPLTFSFIFPSIIFTIFLLFGMYFLFYLILKSKIKSYFAISFFFLSSGLGFINFIKDFISNPHLSSFLYPATDYTSIGEIQWYTGNAVMGMLIPQRGFLLGMTLAVWSMVMLLYVILKEKTGPQAQKILILSGLLAGILPIVHMHSFIVLFIVTGITCISVFKKWKLFLYYVIPAGMLSTILYFIFIYGGIENPRFFSWFPGWTIRGGFFGWLKMWVYFWGPMIPLAIFGLIIYWKKFALPLKLFFIGFFVLFIFSNLFLIQPIAWDNSKLFLWSYFGFSALASIGTAWFWDKKIIGKIIASLFVFLLIFTGVLVLIRMQRIDKNMARETSTEDIKLGEEIRNNTDQLAVFLTSADHNHFIMMWAVRPILMGYPAWVENFGFNYGQRWRDLYTMFSGGTIGLNLLKKYNVSYVVIGMSEIRNYGANEEYFYDNFELAFYNNNYHIYDVRKPKTASFRPIK